MAFNRTGQRIFNVFLNENQCDSYFVMSQLFTTASDSVSNGLLCVQKILENSRPEEHALCVTNSL